MFQDRPSDLALLVMTLKHAVGNANAGAVEFIGVESGLAKQAPGFLGKTVHELSAQFDRNLSGACAIADVRGEHTSAHAVTRLHDRNAQSGSCKNAAGGHARNAGAKDRDVVLHSGLLFDVRTTMVVPRPH